MRVIRIQCNHRNLYQNNNHRERKEKGREGSERVENKQKLKKLSVKNIATPLFRYLNNTLNATCFLPKKVTANLIECLSLQ